MHHPWNGLLMLPLLSLGLANCARSNPPDPEPSPPPAMPMAAPPAARAPVVIAQPPAAPNPPIAPMAPTAAAPADEHEHEHGGHAHGSPHGGEVMSAPGGHVEVKLDRSGRVTLWLLDQREQTVAAQGATARIRLAIAGAVDVPLSYNAAQNALSGQVAVPSAEHVVGLVTVARAGGAPTSLRFAFHLETGGH
jgi:hypothetical protein